MPANTSPIFTLTPNTGSARITAQQASSGRNDGNGTVGTDIFLVCSAGSNGTFVSGCRVKAAATAAGTSTTATTIRFYKSSVNTGSTTSSNTKLIGEISIPAITAASTTVATPDYFWPYNKAIGSGEYILAGSGNTLAANTEFQVTAEAGDY